MDNILGSAWRIARIRRAFGSFVLTLKRRARRGTITPAMAITEPLPALPGAVPESTGAPCHSKRQLTVAARLPWRLPLYLALLVFCGARILPAQPTLQITSPASGTVLSTGQVFT